MPRKESSTLVNQALMVAAISLMLGSTASAAGTDRTLYAFTGGADGEYPLSGVIIDAKGNLYGTTNDGGTGTCTGGVDGDTACGTVFKLTRSGGGWARTVIYRFKGRADGGNPQSSPVFDETGNLYGTARVGGGSKNCGIVYKLAPTQNGGWTETIVHAFGEGDDGCNPVSHLVFDLKGNLLGTTSEGGGGVDGPFCVNGCGTVFELVPNSDGTWTENILHRFTGRSKKDGQNPLAGVAVDKAGNLWGTAEMGGTFGYGIVFELTPRSGGWQENIVHAFNPTQGSCQQGCQPSSSVIFDGAGNVYGTADNVFKLTPKSGGGFVYSVIGLSLRDGQEPNGLAFDTAGNLYGAAVIGGGRESAGTVFKLSRDANGRWKDTVLHTFAGRRDGLWPVIDSLAMDGQGHLYGTTFLGGDAPLEKGDGVVFEITP